MIRSVAWGLFCACSWTWVIGMFLPRLMLEWYGIPGFLVFAIPNVLGCALFGFVLRHGRDARRLCADHEAATTWFSVATVGYHLLFAGYFVRELLPEDRDATRVDDLAGALVVPLGAMAIIYGGGLLLAQLRDRAWAMLAPLLWIASMLIAVRLAPDFSLEQLVPSRPGANLLPLALPIVFGFALCPYLDRTFHRAVIVAGGPRTFAIFGIGFAAMLGVTCVVWFRPTPVLGALAIGHLVAQAIFTVGAHLREVRSSPWANAAPGRRSTLLAVPWVAGVAFIALAAIAAPSLVGEAAYLRYLALYGLVFPLYVLLFIGPFRPLSWRRGWPLFVAVMVIAAPFYEVAFVHGMAWGALIVLPGVIAWIVVRRRSV